MTVQIPLSPPAQSQISVSAVSGLGEHVFREGMDGWME